jgi:hypothetical protein
VKWESATEELEYLNSLANPTPEQFKRKKELGALITLENLRAESEYKEAIAKREEQAQLAYDRVVQLEGTRLDSVSIKEYKDIIAKFPYTKVHGKALQRVCNIEYREQEERLQKELQTSEPRN